MSDLDGTDAPGRERRGGQRSAQEAQASRVLACLEEAWRAIQAHHPDVPDAVVILGSGVAGGRLVKLGHWWTGQWRVGDDTRGEVLLAGEALGLSSREVFAVLCHEAAHGLAAVRRIPDTSRGGRYHNRRFSELAREVGLEVERTEAYGWATTSLAPGTAQRYQDVIDRLDAEMRMARALPDVQPGQRQGRSTPAAECGCGRKLRMAPSVLALGPVVCGVCQREFAMPTPAPPVPQAPSPALDVVDESFLRRRAEAIAQESEGPSELRHLLEAAGLMDWLEERAVALLLTRGQAEDLEMAASFAEAKEGIRELVYGLYPDAEVVAFPGGPGAGIAGQVAPAEPAAGVHGEHPAKPNGEPEPARSTLEDPEQPTVEPGGGLDLRSVELPRHRGDPPGIGRERPGPEHEPPGPEMGR